MRRAFWSLSAMLLAGCAGRQPLFEGEVAPYKALVAFAWEHPDAAPEGDGSNGDGDDPLGGLPREEVEQEILDGIEEYRAFSAFVRSADGDDRHFSELAAKEEADLILRVKIRTLGEFGGEKARSTGLGILEAVLWISTGILSWWVPDTSYSTQSDVEVEFRGIESTQPLKDRLSSSSHTLSFWDRSKPWRQPWAYLTSFVIPPIWVPFEDERDVDRALASGALEDIKRDLAGVLRGGYLGDVGAPFAFRLESPRNGATVQGRKVKLQFKYRGGTSAGKEGFIPLGSLVITIRDREGKLIRTRAFEREELDRINRSIETDDVIEEEVEIDPGLNQIRIVGRTEILNRWVRNTVVLTSE